jgi:site-specific recombinase XerD
MPAAIRPHDVATYIEQPQNEVSAPSVKQQLAAIRMLFDWLVIGQIVPTNPAAALRGPKHVVKTGKTPVLEGTEWRKLLKSIPDATLRDLRDRALIAALTYSFARINAALKMKVEDLRPRGAGWTIRLHEKGGKQHAMPCHHALAEVLRAYIDAAGLSEHRKGWLFRTARGHNGSTLSAKPMSQPDAWRMIRRRAAAAGIAAPIGCHTFRATGITAYLANGGALEQRAGDGGARKPAHNEALRPHQGATHSGRGGTDQVMRPECPPPSDRRGDGGISIGGRASKAAGKDIGLESRPRPGRCEAYLGMVTWRAMRRLLSKRWKSGRRQRLRCSIPPPPQSRRCWPTLASGDI